MKSHLKEIRNRFYVGAEACLADIEQHATGNGALCKATMADAVEDARRKLEKYSNREAVVIVKIIAVVRRAELPVVVETELDEGMDMLRHAR